MNPNRANDGFNPNKDDFDPTLGGKVPFVVKAKFDAEEDMGVEAIQDYIENAQMLLNMVKKS